jgi:valyl-tRNA synthetase
MTDNMDRYELGVAVQKVYNFIWDEFCDWYIEIVKPRLYGKEADPVSANAALWTLRTVLTNALKLLHPFMPFITEEIYCTLCPEEETIMLAQWPKYRQEWNFAREEDMLERIKDLVKGIRNIRSEMDVPPARKAKLFINAKTGEVAEIYEKLQSSYQNLASASEIHVAVGTADVAEEAVSVVIPDAVCYIPLEDLVDRQKEQERLMREKDRLTKELARSQGMLSNEKFLSRAPEAKVEEEKAKLVKYQQMMAEVENRLAAMI